MVVFNYSGSEVNAKIVYYGPALSGKTTNLEYIYERMPSDSKGKMVSMKTRTDRTLFFDFLPIELGDVSGYKTRMLLYTVPGQVYYNATRKLVLKGADAVVFVADSAPTKLKENIESLRNLEENLNEHDLTLDTIPWVIQYNKRDLQEALPVKTLETELNLLNVRSFEASATQGIGIYETFQAVAGMLYNRLVERLERSADPVPPAQKRAPVKDGSGKEQPRSEVNHSVSQVLDVALREVEDRGTPRSVEQMTGPRPAQVAAESAQPQAGGAPVAAMDTSETPRTQVAVPEVTETDEESEEGTFGFESLETGRMDEKVGRLVDLEEKPDQRGPDLAPRAPSGEFITDPWRSGETEPVREEELSEAISTTEDVDLQEKSPSNGDECIITVPVLVSRAQTRKTIPIKLALEIQVVDDDM
ncbi:MAG: GTPase domain-containing protein [Candidatus Latescibacterota bacterium]|nr:MAG: GTPase domain-containing protein [Candidatus Latescibacterota bacterium]